VSHFCLARPRMVCWPSTVICNVLGERHRVRSWCKVMPLFYVPPTPRFHGPVLSLSTVCNLHLCSCLLLPASFPSIQILKHHRQTLTRSNAVPLLLTGGLFSIYIQHQCANSHNQHSTIISNRLGWIRVAFILPKQPDRQPWRRYRFPVHSAGPYSGAVQL